MMRRPQRAAWLLFALFLTAAVVAPAAACPFCGAQGKTLTQEVRDATMVLYGSFKNARLGGAGGDGTTDFEIDAAIKLHEVLGGKKVITLPRYVTSQDKGMKYLVFCDVLKDRIDPYHGRAVKANAGVDKYLLDALALKGQSQPKRLRFFFDYLDHADNEVATDALKEWANASYDDYRAMARNLPPDKLAGWLKDESTPSNRLGLYGSLLGHCGGPKHAALLRGLLERSGQRYLSGSDGLLAGYILIQPREGWDFAVGLMKDPKCQFSMRYAVLRTVRFFWQFRPDVIDKKQLVEGSAHLLEQSDVADLVIEDLRKWGQFKLSERIVGLYGKPGHDASIIRRAILRYALSCPKDDTRAARLVAEVTAKEPQMVEDAQELLKLEAANAKNDGNK